MTEKLWVEKYRPKKISDCVFQSKEVSDLLNSFVKKKIIPNLLLSGIQGTGKTTIARALINELKVDDFDCLKINASSETGIDNVRDKIQTFCKTLPLGDIKIVLLEEADGLSHHAQAALRVLTEDYSDTCRFIYTCNYPHKIIAPIKSRCQHIHIDSFPKDDIYAILAPILTSEKIEVEDIETLVGHVERYSPDIRKIINSIQQSSATGKLLGVMGLETNNDVKEEWIRIWKDKPNRKELLGLVSGVDSNNYEEFYQIMYNNVESLPEDKRLDTVTIIAEHLYKAGSVVDQEINLAACVIKVFS